MRLSPFVFLLALPALAAPSFTLERVLGSAFPSELTASPAGAKIAWASREQGVHNLWVAEAPAYQGRQVTGFTDDDGLEISNVAWNADSTALVFVRGGGANAQGEYPNPRGVPQGVRQTVWIAPLTGGARQIAEGASPALSPDGKTLAYISGAAIWTASLTGTPAPAQLIRARGAARQVQWSPDGEWLAFLSDRGNHSFVGVYNLPNKNLRYPDPSVDRDAYLTWAPHSLAIAYIRIPAAIRDFAFGPVRTAEPWSIRVYDPVTDHVREIWRADPGPGSAFHEMEAATQLLWGEKDRLVFPWEREGYLHLYSVGATGGPAVALTPGTFEVEHVTLGADRKDVVFSSNQGDVDRRHLWRAALDRSTVTAVTKGDGIEWSPAVSSDGAAVAYLHSTGTAPARPVIQIGAAMHDLQPPAVPYPLLPQPEPVLFKATDGMTIHGQLFLPPAGTPTGKRPAVIFFHGGSRRQMLLGWHYMFYYHQAYGFNQYLASLGFVVLSVNYRSGIGYGLDFREAKDYGATGASEYQDVAGAGLYLRSRADVDPQRIGLWGGSYGGYLTALGLARGSDLFAAGVDLHGVHDWNTEIPIFASQYQPEKQREAARIAFASSPMSSIDTWKSPVLLIHGDDDRNVDFSQTVMLVEALRKRKVPVEQLVFPDEVHDLLLHGNWLRAYHAAADFFTGRLVTGAKAP